VGGGLDSTFRGSAAKRLTGANSHGFCRLTCCSERILVRVVPQPVTLKLERCHFRQAVDHQVDYGYPNHGFTGFRPQLGLFAQAPVPIERPMGAFHDPALRMTAKPLPVSERFVISSRIGRCDHSALTQFISGLA
jgi:hypothetical protein